MTDRRMWLAAVCALVVCGGAAVALTRPPLHAAPGPPRAVATAGTVVPLTEGFEGGLDSFTSFSIGCAMTRCLWGSTTTASHTGTHAAFAADVPEVGDDNLVLVNALAIPANATSASLTFWHNYGFEYSGNSFYDGGVLELSTDAGTSWADAGTQITVGGYNGTIATGSGNPLAGRAGWVATTAGTWTQVQVNLLPYRGPSFLLRLRFGTDNSNVSSVAGWWVDDVQVSYDAPLASCARAWDQPAVYPGAVAGPAVASLGGLLYSFGGKTTTAQAAAYRYDPAGGAWTPIAALPEARAFASAVTDGSAIYILGGSDTGNQPTATLWRYDPATNSYVTLAPYTTATLGQGAAYLNGRIYRIAGEVDPTQGTSTTTVEVYTVATNMWAAAPAYPQAVFGLAVLALGGDIYTAGGAQYLGLTAKTYRYDPGAGVWDDGPIADLPGPAGSTAAGFYNGRWLLAAGGYGSTANVVTWDPAANTWSSLDEAPQAVTQAGGAVAGSAFYMVGGRVGSAPTNVTQAYTETACATPEPPRRRPPRRPASARRPARCSSATCPPAALSMPMCAAWPAAASSAGMRMAPSMSAPPSRAANSPNSSPTRPATRTASRPGNRPSSTCRPLTPSGSSSSAPPRTR